MGPCNLRRTEEFHGIFMEFSTVFHPSVSCSPWAPSHLRQETSCGVNSGGAFRSILGPNSSDSSAYSSSLEWLHASTISKSHVVKPIQKATIWSSDLYHPSMVILGNVVGSSALGCCSRVQGIQLKSKSRAAASM